jgi:hypothetical protein
MPTSVTTSAGRKCLTKSGLASHYGRVGRTITRWVKAGVIPAPDFQINGRDYWYEQTIEDADRARTVAAGESGSRVPA